MASTDVAARRTLDLTRAPDERWNEEMFRVVASTVIKGAATRTEQVYCLTVADSLGLNPLIGEIYFIPSKSKDGGGSRPLQPYIGRNGLVKKASERDAYYESDTVHANDRFRIMRKADGTRTLTHSYGVGDRGEIVGAYAFLHFRNGDAPSFFYAPLEEYLPTFDQDWKMQASPWGNQRSAMIEKCAMIGAGRKRLDLGNVLTDGEIDILSEHGAGDRGPAVAQEFSFASLTENGELAARLEVAADAAAWPPAKREMVATGMSGQELEELAIRLEREAVERQAAPQEEEISDVEIVPDEPPPARESGEREESLAALERRRDELERTLAEPVGLSDHQIADLEAEIDSMEGEIRALTDPGQGTLV